MIYRGLNHRSWDISNLNTRKGADSAEIPQNTPTSNTHTSETVSHSIINNTNFWKCVTRPFRCIYVNCFSRLRFLAEFSTKLQKIQLFFWQFTDHNSGRKMTPYFSSTFSNLLVIFISEFENAQNSCSIFMWCSRWSILVCKIPQILAKSYWLRQLITLF